MTRRLRVGVVGCGTIAQVMHLPYLDELGDRFEVAALCDVDEAALEHAGERFRFARRHRDVAALLAEALDAVLVLTGGDHTEVVMRALASGCHVFCEKPLAYTLGGVDAIERAASDAGRVVMVGMTNRYDPGYVRGAAAAREVRDLRYVDAHVLHPENALYLEHLPLRRPPPDDGAPLLGAAFDAMLQDAILSREPHALLAELAGSTAPDDLLCAFFLLASSIHDVNALRGVLGEPTDVVSAESWAGGTSVTAVLAFGERVRATYTWCFAPHLRAYEQRYSFVGSDSRVHVRFPSPFLRSAPTTVEVESMRDGDHVRTRLIASYEEAFKLELIHFHDCVVHATPPLTGVADFRRDYEVLAAIVRACRRS